MRSLNMPWRSAKHQVAHTFASGRRFTLLGRDLADLNHTKEFLMMPA